MEGKDKKALVFGEVHSGQVSMPCDHPRPESNTFLPSLPTAKLLRLQSEVTLHFLINILLFHSILTPHLFPFCFLTCGHILPGRLILCVKASQPNKFVDGFCHSAACTASSGAMKASDHAGSLLLNFSWISVCYITRLCGVIRNRSLAS